MKILNENYQEVLDENWDPQNRDLTLFDVRSRRGMIEWPFAIAGPSGPWHRGVRLSFPHILADLLTLFESSGSRLYPPYY